MGRRLIFIKKNSPGYDADAQAFLTATGITDLTISNAINDLVIGLKSDSLWSKFTAIYPFVGGTAFTHKFNLKNPIDTDAAHRITYIGTPSHNSNGIDCTSGGCDLKIIPSSHLTLNDTHISFNSKTDVNGVLYDIYSNGCIQIFSRLSNLFLCDMYDLSGGLGRALIANTNSIGFFMASRLTAPTHTLYKNGTSVVSNGTTSGSLGSDPLLLGVGNTGINYSSRIYDFSTVGLGFNSTEAGQLHSRKTTFNTALGR